MGRIVAVDYGNKRVGIAVTDELKMIATSLTTVHSKDVLKFLSEYCNKENVECFVIGEPKQMNNTYSQSEVFILSFIKNLKKLFPTISIERYDERFTSKIAFNTMIEAGLKKKDRQNKAIINNISATIILQSFLEYKQNMKIYTNKK